MTVKTAFALLLASAFHLHAAPRPWKSEDGQRSFQGDFLARNDSNVTIRRSADGREVTLALGQLHPDDRTWVNANHPAAGTGTPDDNSAAPDESAVFDQLVFGDNREQVLTKLKASKFVEMTTDETFIGRSGLNGVFRTRQQIGGLHAMLYFDWTDDNQLKEITLQTDPLPASELPTHLVPCWTDFIALLTTLHGQPIVADKQLHLSSIPDGSFLPTHLWKLEKTGSAQLGAARDGDKYQIVVRFTKEEIKPVALP